MRRGALAGSKETMSNEELKFGSSNQKGKNLSTQSTGYAFKGSLLVLGLCLLALLSAFFIPQWRKHLQLLGWGESRKILATLIEDLDRSGNPVSIFKVREKGSLFIEVYSTHSPDGLANTIQSRSFELIQKLELPGAADGFVSFMGETTNLAVANLDNDPYLELIIPSYNFEFVASLDIIKYNPGTKKYELMSSFDIPEGLFGSFSKDFK